MESIIFKPKTEDEILLDINKIPVENRLRCELKLKIDNKEAKEGIIKEAIEDLCKKYNFQNFKCSISYKSTVKFPTLEPMDQMVIDVELIDVINDCWYDIFVLVKIEKNKFIVNYSKMWKWNN